MVPMKRGPPGSTVNCSHALKPACISKASTLFWSKVQPVTLLPLRVTVGRPAEAKIFQA